MIQNQKVVEAVCEYYKAGLTGKQTAKKVGISSNVAFDIIHEHGLTRNRGERGPTPVGVPEESSGSMQVAMQEGIMRHVCMERVCPACGNTKHLKGARFCMECGALLATKRELALQAADNLRKFLEPYKATRNMEHVLRDLTVVSEYIQEDA